MINKVNMKRYPQAEFLFNIENFSAQKKTQISFSHQKVQQSGLNFGKRTQSL
jgi:hypothetical protein